MRPIQSRELSRHELALIIGVIAVYSILYYLYAPYLGNPIIDTYTDLWVGFELYHDKVLYRDVFYPYGPFIPKLFSYIWHLTSSPKVIYTTISFTSGIYVLGLMRYICSLIDLPKRVTAITLLFVTTVLLFNPHSEIFSIVKPYSWSTLTFTLAVIHLIAINLKQGKASHILGPIVFAICALTRPTMFIPIGSIYLLYSYMTYGFRISALHLIATILLYIPLLLLDGSLQDFTTMIALHSSEAANSEFHQFLAGFYDPELNGLKTLVSFLGLSLLSAVALWKRVSVKVMSVLAFSTFLAFSYYKIEAPIYLLGLPLINICIMLYYFRKKRYEYALWGALNTMLNLRFMINSNINLNSAIFILPVIPYVIQFAHELTRERDNATKTKVRTALLCIIGCFINEDIREMSVMTKSSYFLSLEHRSIELESTLSSDLEKLIPKLKERDIKTIQVLPEGTIVNLELGTPSPMALLPLVPTHFYAIGPERIIEELKTKRVEHILLLKRNYKEYFETYFGESFGKEVLNYIISNYTVTDEVKGSYKLFKRDSVMEKTESNTSSVRPPKQGQQHLQ